MTTLTAVFDGESLRPDGPVDLVPNRRYRVHLEPAEDLGTGEGESAWDVLAQLDGSTLRGVTGSAAGPLDPASSPAPPDG